MGRECQLFVPITKVDATKREVWGVAAEEAVDKSNECFDYEGSKGPFAKWSADFQKATGGKSRGNVREMHQPKAVGKVIDISFDDAAKRIPIGVHVVDKDAWEKVESGVYTGFSIGGRYAKRWDDPAQPGVTRYIAEPSEVSLVDNPCMHGATFEAVLRADAPAELRKFTGSPETTAVYTEKIAARSDTSPTEGEDKYGDVAFADPENKKYPIDTVAHIRAAWNYINKPKNAGKYSTKDAAAIKRRIIAAWKKKIDADGPPSAEKAQLATTLLKNLYDVGQLASLLATLDWLVEMAEAEAAREGDDSPVPQRFEIAVQSLGDVLVAMTAEEVGELHVNADTEPGHPLAMYVRAARLAKAGRRNSSADQRRIQAMHDTSVELGADCATDGDETEKRAAGAPAAGGDMDAQELKKALDERDSKLDERLGAAIEKAVSGLNIGDEITKALAPTNEKVDGLVKTVEDQGARLKALEEQPLPGRAVTRVAEVGKTVAVGAGAGTSDERPSVDGLIKAALAKGLDPQAARDEAALELTKWELAHPKRAMVGAFVNTAGRAA
jgi:hypothetical protein